MMVFLLGVSSTAWAEGFKATVDGEVYKPSLGNRLLEIEREWSPGDSLQVKIPLDIRIVPDGDKTTESVAFVRGPQLLATNTEIEANGGIPESGWWGDALYAYTVKQNGVKKESQLVNFADAGQNKEEYTVLHEGIESPVQDTATTEGKGKGDDPVCNNSAEDGYRTIVQGKVTREYILHVPASYDSNSPTPLVINFHGFGDCAADYSKLIGDFYNLDSLADSRNFLVAYPQAVVREKGAAYWDPGDNGSQSIKENDAHFTEQLISDISNDYNVDLSRVYATGYSNGGMMAYGLACSRGDLIAAAGIMSGIMLKGTCDVNEYTSIIHFHGVADDALPYEGNQNFQSVSDVVKFWLNHNNIPIPSLVTTELNGGDVVRDEYTGGTENTSVVLYTVKREHDKDGGHVWFSDDIGGTNPNQILWDFFATYSLDD